MKNCIDHIKNEIWRFLKPLGFRKHGKIDVKSCIDRIENEIYRMLKPLGFRKHGRTLHRFVSGDISQVVNFQCGESYRKETHLMWVNIGIRVPECMERTFEPQTQKKYYHEYDCNMRTSLGVTDQDELASRANPNLSIPQGTAYDLRNDLDEIINDISSKIVQDVLPAFDVLSSREAILAHRRDYPRYDIDWKMILLDEAMIYGRNHDIGKAKELFEVHYRQTEEDGKRLNVPGGFASHLSLMDELALKLGLREP